MGAENADIPIGGTVAVFGQGPVGLMATAGARLRGAELIIAIEAVPKRQGLARLFGADEVVDYSKEDVVARIRELTVGQGGDSGVEDIGADRALPHGVRAT